MNITNIQLLRGCLLSSIAHAIMTNVYPDLSYEQSWDGKNFSIQDENGRRGTITFLDDCCIGALRDDNADPIQGFEAIDKWMLDFPETIQSVAKAETLQYLLVDDGDASVPSVTSIFWCDNNGIYVNQECVQNLRADISLLENCYQPLDIALDALRDYYDMEPEACDLLLELWKCKGDSIEREIVLTKEQKQLLPGDDILSECVESFEELNILL